MLNIFAINFDKIKTSLTQYAYIPLLKFLKHVGQPDGLNDANCKKDSLWINNHFTSMKFRENANLQVSQ